MILKDIKKGPGKWDLAKAIMDGQLVEFTVVIQNSKAEPTVESLKINTLEAEDGSRESWNLKGYTLVGGRNFIAYYNTRKNTGHIRIEN